MAVSAAEIQHPTQAAWEAFQQRRLALRPSRDAAGLCEIRERVFGRTPQVHGRPIASMAHASTPYVPLVTPSSTRAAGASSQLSGPRRLARRRRVTWRPLTSPV